MNTVLTPEQQVEYQRCAHNELYFWYNYCRTFDAHDPLHKAKLMRRRPQWDFLAWAFNRPKSCGSKSRQIGASWGAASDALYRAKFGPGLRGLMLSDVEGKAGFGGSDVEGASEKGDEGGLLGKVSLLHRNLPEWMHMLETSSRRAGATNLTFTKGVGADASRAVIHARSSKTSAVQSLTLNAVWVDEAGLQRDLQKRVNGIGPALGTEGTLSLFGTPDNREAHYRTYFGIKDSDEVPDTKTVYPPFSYWNIKFPNDKKGILVPSRAKEWKPGIWYWITDEGWLGYAIHYSADPDHRSVEWAEPEFSRTDLNGWLLHYELDWWATEAGERGVCPSWTTANIREDCVYDPNLGTVIRTWDPGTKPAVIFSQLGIRQQQDRCFDVYAPSTEISTLKFSQGAVERSKQYGTWFRNFGDKGGRNRSDMTLDSNEKTSFDIIEGQLLEEAKRNGVPREMAFIETKEIGSINAQEIVTAKVGQRLEATEQAPNGEPGVIVHPKASLVIDALGGKLSVDKRGKRRREGRLEHVYDAEKIKLTHLFPRISEIISYTVPLEAKKEVKTPYQAFLDSVKGDFEQLDEDNANPKPSDIITI